MRKAVLFLFVPFISGLVACEGDSAPARRGAIVFGDSSMIVTETDPKYLNDNVADFQPKAVPIAKDSSLPVPAPAAVPAATPDTKAEVPAPAEAVSKTIRIEIPGIAGSDVDWNKRHGVSVTAEESALKGKSLRILGLSELKVQQRVQSVVMIKLRRGGLVKLALPGDYSNWESVNGRNGVYAIQEERPVYSNRINANALRNAVQRVAKANRLSRRETEELLRSVRNVHTATQRPLEPAVQSYVWRIDGKGADGKTVHREIRVDMQM